jgi:phosphotransferase system enzyme I (PtsI)
LKAKEMVLKGIPICRGIAIGKPFVLNHHKHTTPEKKLGSARANAEVLRYRKALSKSREELKSLQKELKAAQMLEGVSILESQLMILQDSMLTTHMEKEIVATRKNAEAAFLNIISQYQKKFDAISDSFFKDRFKEIQDISSRVMKHLTNNSSISLVSLPSNSIIISKDLSTSQTAEAHIGNAHAFVTELVGINSHAAIVAKSKGTPFVSNINFDKINPLIHHTVIVDGRRGEIILNPTPETLAKYQKEKDALNEHLDQLNQFQLLKGETYDGYTIKLSANIEMPNEMEAAKLNGAEAIGLYRTEYMVLNNNHIPDEEEQFHLYKQLVEGMQPESVVIRTFDIGGDKKIPHLNLPHEVNPFLGCRSIRYLLKEQDLFKTQLRAILRASLYGKVKILFPLISTLSELLEAKNIFKEVYNELIQKGHSLKPIPVGCMIEVPSAALIADLLAKECDFLSIGTNDLIQYILAVDRGSPTMNGLYKPSHPSVIRMIKSIVHEANLRGIPVSICGEVAADPRFSALLLGLGVQEFSVSPRYIPTIKHAIRHSSILSAFKLAEEALTLSTAEEIESLLDREYKTNVPHDCFYNC